MKWLFVLLLVAFVFVAGAAASGGAGNLDPVPDEHVRCDKDSDCIPLPSQCHPHSCINQEYQSSYSRPEMCTEVFDCSAAYTPKDCVCEGGACANDNLYNNGCSTKRFFFF